MSSKANRARSLLSTEVQSCVVCLREPQVFAIGECDHFVCHTCSTKMRVLCEQKECPICRMSLPSVVFSSKMVPYQQLKSKVYLHEDLRHGIKFENLQTKEEFSILLRKLCPICNKKFSNFPQLMEHVKADHDRYYCEICVSGLKIFPSERKWYTKNELDRHYKEGDINDTSHKGHPLCKICNKRYLSPDELFKHSRKTHFMCYICETHGNYNFFETTREWKEHFGYCHYVCTSGECGRAGVPVAFETQKKLHEHQMEKHQLGNGIVGQPTRTARGRGHFLNDYIPNVQEPAQYQQNQSSTSGRRGNSFLDGLYDSDYFRANPPLGAYYEPSPEYLNRHNNTPKNRNEEFPALQGPSSKPNPTVSQRAPTTHNIPQRNLPKAINNTNEFPPLGGGSSGKNKKKNPKNSTNNHKPAVQTAAWNGQSHGNNRTAPAREKPKGGAQAAAGDSSINPKAKGTPKKAEGKWNYQKPKNFNQRNIHLMHRIQGGLHNNKEMFRKFVTTSKKFQSDEVTAREYYRGCLEILGAEGVQAVFAELLFLLPVIKKQNELLSVCGVQINDLYSCPTCKQVMDLRDINEHERYHSYGGAVARG